MATKAKKPRALKMPESGAPVADVGTSFDRFVQLHASGTYEPKTVRAIAAWLLKAAKWMERD